MPKLSPVEARLGEAPLPVPPTPRRDEIFKLLAGLERGKSLDINRKAQTMRVYVTQFRQQYDAVDRKFLIRTLRPGWARMWRTQ
jgi:hypothetical protein